MFTTTTPSSRWRRFIANLWQAIAMLECSLDTQWFRHVQTLGFDVICRRLAQREVAIIVSLPYLCRLVINIGSIRTLYKDVPSITETGFEISAQHIRLSWKRSLVGRLKRPGYYWIRLWRDIVGVQVGGPYVKRLMATETHHYYFNDGNELRLHAIEVEAILYGQRVRGRWWWPLEMERKWVEIRTSQPIATQLGFISRHVYNRPTAKHLIDPLSVFRKDLIRMGLCDYH